jgi:hypothetical protein
VVVFDEPPALPEGGAVEVEAVELAAAATDTDARQC